MTKQDTKTTPLRDAPTTRRASTPLKTRLRKKGVVNRRRQYSDPSPSNKIKPTCERISLIDCLKLQLPVMGQGEGKLLLTPRILEFDHHERTSSSPSASPSVSIESSPPSTTIFQTPEQRQDRARSATSPPRFKRGPMPVVDMDPKDIPDALLLPCF